MVMSEILRKYPPVGFLNRKTMETYQIPNFNLVLEKDMPVYIPMLALHYDSEYFPNPEKFDPERFNEENKRNMPSCVYFPFGDGPHVCIGEEINFNYHIKERLKLPITREIKISKKNGR